MKTRKIIDLLDLFLGGDRVKRSRRERAVQDLLDKLEKKEQKLLDKLEHSQSEEDKRHIELKLEVNRAHQDKARQAIDSWSPKES